MGSPFLATSSARAWLPLIPILGSLALAHFLSLGQSPLWRMLLLSTVLMLGMKLWIYQSWSHSSGRHLPGFNRICFTFLWVGMDPESWRRHHSHLTWKRDAIDASACLIAGTSGLILLRKFGVSHVIPLFLVTSLAFHFGALGLLRAYWRRRGIATKCLFRNPLRSRSLADFWSRRWNLAYSQMISRLVDRPLKGTVKPPTRLILAFLISGLIHEVAITLPIQSHYGLPTLFFLIQGCLVLVFEKLKLPTELERPLALTSLIAGLPLLFPQPFVDQVIIAPLTQIGL